VHPGTPALPDVNVILERSIIIAADYSHLETEIGPKQLEIVSRQSREQSRVDGAYIEPLLFCQLVLSISDLSGHESIFLSVLLLDASEARIRDQPRPTLESQLTCIFPSRWRS
jgi:hypothetical protein